MWNQGEKSNIENLDNYISAIENAKEELNKINIDIKSANEQKEKILQSNHDLLKERLDLLDSHRESLEILLKDAKEDKANNLKTLEELEEKHREILSRDIELSEKTNFHQRMVDNRNKEFLGREDELTKSMLNIKNQQEEIDSKIMDNNKILKKIEDENKKYQELLAQSDMDKKSHQDTINDINKSIEENKEIKSQCEAIRDEANRKLDLAQKYLDESRINKEQVDENLKCILKEKEDLNNLIIENKKTKLESIKSIEISQRNMAEANLKMAELRDLKESMSK